MVFKMLSSSTGFSTYIYFLVFYTNNTKEPAANKSALMFANDKTQIFTANKKEKQEYFSIHEIKYFRRNSRSG